MEVLANILLLLTALLGFVGISTWKKQYLTRLRIDVLISSCDVVDRGLVFHKNYTRSIYGRMHAADSPDEKISYGIEEYKRDYEGVIGEWTMLDREIELLQKKCKLHQLEGMCNVLCEANKAILDAKVYFIEKIEYKVNRNSWGIDQLEKPGAVDLSHHEEFQRYLDVNVDVIEKFGIFSERCLGVTVSVFRVMSALTGKARGRLGL